MADRNQKHMYMLMRKNDPITEVSITDSGDLTWYSKDFINRELAPLQSRLETDWLRQWWASRSIPVKQGQAGQILKQNGISCPEEFLVKNLGLSLTDYYWIRPAGSGLKWEEVNFYENNFYDNMLTVPIVGDSGLGSPDRRTPNGSLQGQLEKSWTIGRSGARYLVKGNHGALSSESINEVIATELHRLQGYDNYTPYGLIHIKGKPYTYGCYSKAFTNLDRELVSAYAVITSEKKRNDISWFEHFIQVSGQHGIDKERLRIDLEYQILADFVLTGTDRHLSNISILRDADTLEFIGMAPIYDSGKCLFVNQEATQSDKGNLLNVKTTSFSKSEKGLLRYAPDRDLLDITKLPSPEYVRGMYEKDENISEKRIDAVVRGYELKIDMLRDLQLGRDPYRYQSFVPKQPGIGQSVIPPQGADAADIMDAADDSEDPEL